MPGTSGSLVEHSGSSVGRRVGMVIVVSMSLLLVWSRLANLGTSFWNDESATAWAYIDRGPSAIFSGSSYVPNNHVLFSLLSWATTSIVGRSEAVYRLWSVVPALVAVAIVTWWVWKTFSPLAGAVVVALTAISPKHFLLASQARGYGLAMLAGALMLIGAVTVERGRRRNGLALLIVGGVVGVCTLPVVVLGFVSYVGVLFVQRGLRRSALLTAATVGVASLLFLRPLLTAILGHSRQEFGAQLPWDGPLVGPYRDLVHPNVAALLPRLSGTSTAIDLMVLVGSVGLLWLAISSLLARSEGYVCLHLIVPVVATYLVLTAGRFFVAGRFTSFLFFNVITVLSLGVAELWRIVRHHKTWAFAVVAFATCAMLVGTRHIVLEVRSQAAVPWENARMVRDISRRKKISQVVTNAVAPWSLYYYVGQSKVQILTPQAVADKAYCNRPAPFLLVEQTDRPALPLDVRCLRARRTVRVRVRQQSFPPIGPRGRFDVWIVSRP